MRLSRTLLTASLLAAITPAMAAQHVDLNNILSMQSSTAATADAASSGVTDVRQKAVFQAAEMYAAQVAYCHEAKVVTAFVDRGSMRPTILPTCCLMAGVSCRR